MDAMAAAAVLVMPGKGVGPVVSTGRRGTGREAEVAPCWKMSLVSPWNTRL